MGLFVIASVLLHTPTDVTVPLPPLPPPVLPIVMHPVAALSVTPVPATKQVTPPLQIVYALALLFDMTMPLPALIVVIGLAAENRQVKLVCTVLKAQYKLSEFAGLFGWPMLIGCCPDIDMVVSSIYYLSIIGEETITLFVCVAPTCVNHVPVDNFPDVC